MVGKLKKLSTTCIQITFPDSVVRLLKNRIQPKLFPDSRLRRNFNLKQRYLANRIRYGGDYRGIGKMLKSSCSHKNFIIFGQVDLDWHRDGQTALKNRSERTRYTKPNYLFIDSNFNIFNYGTCGHAHKVPTLITKIQLTHKHNNNPTRHTKVHTAPLDST